MCVCVCALHSRMNQFISFKSASVHIILVFNTTLSNAKMQRFSVHFKAFESKKTRRILRAYQKTIVFNIRLILCVNLFLEKTRLLVHSVKNTYFTGKSMIYTQFVKFCGVSASNLIRFCRVLKEISTKMSPDSNNF